MHFLQTHTQAAYGGDSSEWCISGRDFPPQPCSARRCSTFFSSEQTHLEDKKLIRKIANYFVAVSGSDGFMDVAGGFTCVVECGEKHVVVPKQVVRQKEVPVVELTKDEATDFCSRASSTEFSVKERAEQRAGAGHNSAVLVCREGKCLGVWVGTVSVAFRGVAPAASAAATAEVFEIMPYADNASMDLLALAACLGMENHSNSHCIWCRCSAAQLKAIPNYQGFVTVTNPLLTPESQADNLAATVVAKAAAVAKGIKTMPPAGNGVVTEGELGRPPRRRC